MPGAHRHRRQLAPLSGHRTVAAGEGRQRGQHRAVGELHEPVASAERIARPGGQPRRRRRDVERLAAGAPAAAEHVHPLHRAHPADATHARRHPAGAGAGQRRQPATAVDRPQRRVRRPAHVHAHRVAVGVGAERVELEHLPLGDRVGAVEPRPNLGPADLLVLEQRDRGELPAPHRHRDHRGLAAGRDGEHPGARPQRREVDARGAAPPTLWMVAALPAGRTPPRTAAPGSRAKDSSDSRPS